MKLINKFFLGICALSLLTAVSCDKDDDDGPSTPANPGIFTGKLIDPANGNESEWVATSTKAEHDTITGKLTITAENAAGDVIRILLSGTESKVYSLYQNTTSVSTYESSSFAGIATTKTNDVPGGETDPKEGKVYISDSGDDDGKIRGIVYGLHWYIVGEDIDDDVRVAVFSSQDEFEIPLKRVGFDMSGGDKELKAKIDGASFNATTKMLSGFILTGINDSGQSLMISLPSAAASTGIHDVGGASQYSVTYSDGVTAYFSEGIMEVTSIDEIAGTASGTFEVTATPMGGGDSVSITEGVFSF